MESREERGLGWQAEGLEKEAEKDCRACRIAEMPSHCRVAIMANCLYYRLNGSIRLLYLHRYQFHPYG